jgi:hypothetical protein
MWPFKKKEEKKEKEKFKVYYQLIEVTEFYYLGSTSTVYELRRVCGPNPEDYRIISFKDETGLIYINPKTKEEAIELAEKILAETFVSCGKPEIIKVW